MTARTKSMMSRMEKTEDRLVRKAEGVLEVVGEGDTYWNRL
jgi:hypothetical protein